MKKSFRYSLAAALLLAPLPVFMLVSSMTRNSVTSQEQRYRLDMARVLAPEDNDAFQKADRVVPFTFPHDHGPHEGFRSEWWYFTGNLETGEGRRFGYQFTIFRSRLVPEEETTGGSDWRTGQGYMAHFAVTDVGENEFYYGELFARELPGLAEAKRDPYHVYVEDWEVRSLAGSRDFFPARVRAAGDGFALDLVLRPEKGPVLQGDRGQSRKGPEKGNASYYYSYPRLKSEGKVTAGGKSHQVIGTSWFDREWGSSLLGEGTVGWDWFALGLDNGYDIMFYRLRDREGEATRFSHFVVMDPDGGKEEVPLESVEFTVTGTWESPRGREYPSGWELRVPAKRLSLTVTPAVKDQELNLSIPYWEGAVSVKGTRSGREITGRGYVELTGY